MGDGGMVIAASEEVAERLRMLRFHGSRDKQHVRATSASTRGSTRCRRRSCAGCCREVAGWNEARRAAADALPRELGLGELGDAARRGGRAVTHVYHLYVVRSPERDALHGG